MPGFALDEAEPKVAFINPLFHSKSTPAWQNPVLDKQRVERKNAYALRAYARKGFQVQTTSLQDVDENCASLTAMHKVKRLLAPALIN